MRRGFFRLAIAGLVLCLAVGVPLTLVAAYHWYASDFSTAQPDFIGGQAFVFDGGPKTAAPTRLAQDSDGALCNIRDHALAYRFDDASVINCSRPPAPAAAVFARVPTHGEYPPLDIASTTRLVDAASRARSMRDAEATLLTAIPFFSAGLLWFALIWTVGWVVRGFTERA
ncbi:MAG: hypothetical protein AAGK66_09485 [Pseudomonadota bacterium]